MKLVIAEKPSVAMSLAAVLGATERKDGYLEGSGYLVSWCVGHLLELAQPEAYKEQYAKWRYEDLPILPENWKYEVPKDKKTQLALLCRLMKDKRVDSVVCATDAGREGELIFRLVYEYAGCKKPMNRSSAMSCLMQFRNTENRSVKKAKQLQNVPTHQTFSKVKCSVLIVAEAFTGNAPSAGKDPTLTGSTALQTAG